MSDVSVPGLVVVAAVAIGMQLRTLTRATGAAMIAAGLLSVVLFPATAVGLLNRRAAAPEASPSGRT